MREFFYSLKLRLKTLWFGLFIGMKKTEDATLHQSGLDGDVQAGINQEVSEQRVSKALLRGELTQQVKELRYRTYKVDRESKSFEYFSPLLAKRNNEKLDSKFVEYYRGDGLDVITIQPNEADVETLEDSLQRLDSGDKGRVNYTVKVERDFVSRYRIEEYTKRLAVKRSEDGVVLEFYVSIYPNDKDFKSKGFVNELKYVMNGRKTDIFDIESVSFVSYKAYRVQDMLEFSFSELKFLEIVEFDGHYVIRMSAKPDKLGNDLTDEYYCREMDEKYRNKVQKNLTISVDDVGGFKKFDKFVCECCGKEVFYDTEAIDSMEIKQARGIDEDGAVNEGTTEYFDLQMSEQTFGKRLCKDCIEKKAYELYEKSGFKNVIV